MYLDFPAPVPHNHDTLKLIKELRQRGVFRVTVISLITGCVLLINGAWAHASPLDGGEAGSGIDVVGTWVSVPVLGQLGMIENSFTFHEEGTYAHK